MLKQFLSKLPRKLTKSESLDSSSNNSRTTLGNNGVQHSVSGKSNVLKRMSSAVFPSTTPSVLEKIGPYLSFSEVPNSEKQNLFISKLNLCCLVIDFNDPYNFIAEKDLKHQNLLELVDFVASGSARFTESSMAVICRMFAVNLFRAFPPKSRTGGTETEDDEPVFDPSWSHLQVIYDLLLRFINYTSLDLKIAKKYIDHHFILRLLDLFDSEDPRERDCLKTILHRIYGKLMVHRSFIRKAVSNIIYRFIFETEKHNGIAELLEIFASVISGFALPLKEEHKMFLWRAIIPLHKPKSMGIYHQQLTFCVVQFIEKDGKLASGVIKGLLKYWPITNSQKELMFLSELEEILEMTNIAEFEKVMLPMFRRIKSCLNSSHFQVSERSLFLCNNENIQGLIMQYRNVILPILLPALEWNTRHHWNQTVLNLTHNLRTVFHGMDQTLTLACRTWFEDEDMRTKVEAERRKLAWDHLESHSQHQRYQLQQQLQQIL